MTINGVENRRENAEYAPGNKNAHVVIGIHNKTNDQLKEKA
jgi:hypothetical protein